MVFQNAFAGGHDLLESEPADETVKAVDRAVGAGLGAAAGLALKKRRRFLGAILGMFSLISLAVGFGLLREQE